MDYGSIGSSSILSAGQSTPQRESQTSISVSQLEIYTSKLLSTVQVLRERLSAVLRVSADVQKVQGDELSAKVGLAQAIDQQSQRVESAESQLSDIIGRLEI